MKKIIKSTKQRLTDAHSKIFGGIEQIREGCKLFVEVLDTDQDEARAFMKSKGVIDEFLDMIESVGRGRIHPRLMFMPGPGPERLQRAPLVEQERLLNVGVQLRRIVGDEIKTVVKPVSELNKFESEISLDSSGNTPLEKQDERLKQRLTHTTFRLPPYSLDGDTLLARENCRIPFAELERLYQQARGAHTKSLKSLESTVKGNQIK